MRVLILGARAPVCLEWARVFKSTGAYVCVADSLSFPLTRFSNSVDDFVQLPSAATDTVAWLNALIALICEQSIEVLLPTCEEVFYVAHCLPQLKCYCQVPVMDFDGLQRLHHKGVFAQWTQRFAVRAPETHLLNSSVDVLRFSTDSLDWVFKPAYSRFAVKTLIRPKRLDLSEVRPSMIQPWVAQRYVNGIEFCSYSILRDGYVRAHVCYQPRYRVGQGAGIYLQPVVIEAIEQFVRAFGQDTGYSGQVGFDFIQDATGQCHVLECNPRATSGLHLLAHQPQALVRAITQTSMASNDAPMLSASSEPKMVGLAMLLFAAPKHLGSKFFWQDFRRARDLIVAHDDYLPCVSQILGVFELSGRALKHRRGLLDVSTSDIAWDGQTIREVS